MVVTVRSPPDESGIPSQTAASQDSLHVMLTAGRWPRRPLGGFASYRLGTDTIELTHVGILRLRARRSFGVAAEHTNSEVFVPCRIVDRGEREDAATELPILDGGFDQRQLAGGAARRCQGTDELERRRPCLRRGKTRQLSSRTQASGPCRRCRSTAAGRVANG